MNQTQRKAEIAAALKMARNKTLELLTSVPDAQLNLRVHDFYSPIGWHFGHIGMTEEYWVWPHALNQPPRNPEYNFLFANLPENPKDNRVHLPSRYEIIDYLKATRKTTLDALKTADLEADSPLLTDGYAWEFALQHEYQHQETIVELRHLLSKQLMPPRLLRGTAELVCKTPPVEMVALPGNTFWMGSDNLHGYDNEKNAHEVTVAAFELDKTPVTTGHWAQFIAEGGYKRRELWTEDGWNWRQAENVAHPEYWSPFGKGFGTFYAEGIRGLHPLEPVTGVSWYEANAYALWIGKRLPTEAEWEYAAAYEPATGQMRRYPWPDGKAGHGCADFGNVYGFVCRVGEERMTNAFGLCNMAGSAWEWTSTPFLPYPGFTAFPYEGYSKDHMDGKHYVCRGGSWATAEPILRASFRNWYIPTYRQGFLGLRCAK